MSRLEDNSFVTTLRPQNRQQHHQGLGESRFQQVKPQSLVLIQAELLRRSHIGFTFNHIAGEDNDVADLTSRPPPHTTTLLPPSSLTRYTSSSPGYVSTTTLLASKRALYSDARLIQPSLPKTLGSFGPADSTTSLLF